MALHKGIILAGGAGSRLYPLTAIVSKQLLPVHDKPLVYYPLSLFLENRLDQICLISTEDQLPLYRKILGDGSQFGIEIDYRAQAQPDGIAQAFLIAKSFIQGAPVALALGDNIFHGSSALAPSFQEFATGATIFAYQVQNPEDYGVIEFSQRGEVLSLEEKPVRPKSRFVAPGLYLYDANVVAYAKQLRPSARGELEITDLNLIYLRHKALRVVELPRSFVWLDAGTNSGSLHDASSFVRNLEKKQGIKIGCPEEAALRSGLIKPAQFKALVRRMPCCEYRSYLESVAE